MRAAIATTLSQGKMLLIYIGGRSHTGGKPYKCSHCNNAFLKKRNLEIHIRIHTEEISFTDLSNINYYFKIMKHIYKVQRNTFTYENIILSMHKSTMYGYII